MLIVTVNSKGKVLPTRILLDAVVDVVTELFFFFVLFSSVKDGAIL